MRTFIILTLLTLAACDGKIDVPDTCGVGLQPYAGPPQGSRTATYFVPDDPDLPSLAILSGCELWQGEGVECVTAPSDADAEIHVVPDHDPCVKTPSGTYVLAASVGGGAITVDLECIRDRFETEDDGRPSQQVLKLVLGHELGHQFGMWWHVPERCDPSAAADDFEKGLVAQGICGKALMNPQLDLNTCFITDLDARAYALRDPQSSTSGIVATEEPGGGCVLTYRPAP